MPSIRNDEYVKAFGKNLRKLRLDRGLTCEALEEKTGIDFRQISRLERGERSPTISTMLILAKGLNLKPLDLLDFEFDN